MAHPTNETGIAAAIAPIVALGHAQASRQHSAREAIDDGVITAKLRARLMADVVTRSYVIQVETFHGTVVLSGYVELATVRLRALALARELAGENEVKDALETHD
jgi:osmotically-inducible protein OsmY